MTTFDLLADLPLEVDGYELEGLHASVSSGFERLTTVVHLQGGGAEGLGEDVVYDSGDQTALQQGSPRARCPRSGPQRIRRLRLRGNPGRRQTKQDAGQ